MTDAYETTGHQLIVNSAGDLPNLITQMAENGGDMSDSLKSVHVEEWTGPVPEKRSFLGRIMDFLFDPTLMRPVENSRYLVTREVAGSTVTVDTARGEISVFPPGPVLRFVFITENLNRRPQ